VHAHTSRSALLALHVVFQLPHHTLHLRLDLLPLIRPFAQPRNRSARPYGGGRPLHDNRADHHRQVRRAIYRDISQRAWVSANSTWSNVDCWLTRVNASPSAALESFQQLNRPQLRRACHTSCSSAHGPVRSFQLTRRETPPYSLDTSYVLRKQTSNGRDEVVDSVTLQRDQFRHRHCRREAAGEQVGADKVDDLASAKFQACCSAKHSAGVPILPRCSTAKSNHHDSSDVE